MIPTILLGCVGLVVGAWVFVKWGFPSHDPKGVRSVVGVGDGDLVSVELAMALLAKEGEVDEGRDSFC